MIFGDFLKAVNDAVRGIEDDAPTVGNEEALYWARLYNRKKNEMYDDVDKNWESAYDEKLIGTIVAAVAPVFNLDNSDELNDLSNYLAPSRQAYVIDLNGQYHYYDIVKVGDIDHMKQQIYISGQNPKKLRFTRPILPDDSIIGGTLYLPAYWRPDDITGTETTAVISVDDPNWAVMATAAQVAFGDITYEEKFDDLNGQANMLWRTMVKKNRKRPAGGYRKQQYDVYRIRSPR